MTSPPTDPMSMWRDFLGQWEKAANEWGGEALKRPETAQAMHGMTAMGLQTQQAMHETMAKVLAAANMPSKADIETLGTRLAAIEAALARIEAALAAPAAGAQHGSDAPKPARTRKPAP